MTPLALEILDPHLSMAQIILNVVFYPQKWKKNRGLAPVSWIRHCGKNTDTQQPNQGWDSNNTK